MTRPDTLAVLDSIAKPSPAVEWLSRVADTARRLVEESRHDADDTIAQHERDAA